MKHLIFPLFSLFFIAACTGPDPVRDYAQDRLQIESGLLPSVVIEGSPSPTFMLTDRMAHYNVPGVSLAYFEDGAIQWTGTWGTLEAGGSAPVDKETLFQAASISKPVAASGMMRLVQEGVLDLDTDVTAYLKDWKVRENKFTEKEKVTLRRLVSHNAGMTVHGFPGYAANDEFPTTVQVLNGEPPANTSPIVPDTFPGAIWRYSGGGYTVMQHVIENVRQEPFYRSMQELVLDPLGMSRSTYQQPIPRNTWSNIAVAHGWNGNKVEGAWHNYPEMAAAGLWTTPSDLATWALALQKAYNGEEENFLYPATAKQILTRQFGDSGLGPGLGGDAGSLTFSHGGANNGYRCYLFAFARQGGPGFVLMTNSDQGDALGSEIRRAFSDHYGWTQFKPVRKKTIEVQSDSLVQYTGSYKLEDGRTVTLSLEKDTLAYKLGWIEYSATLLPEAKDKFFDEEGVTVTFQRDASGKITSMEAEGDILTKVE